MYFVIPLHSRLNCDHIEARLITNHCEKRSESPIEGQTHVEEESRSILFNQRDLKHNHRVNQVSSVILP